MLLYWPIRIYKSLRFRLLNRLAKNRSRPLFEAAARLISKRRDSLLSPSPAPLEKRLSVLLSFRITEDERLDILRVVSGRVNEALGGRKLPFLVRDASDENHADAAKRLLETIELPLSYQNQAQKLAPAYSEMLRETPTKYFYLQFDDQLTAGLTTEFLEGCCDLLDKYEGLVSVVAVMWPNKVQVSDEARRVEVTDYRRVAGARGEAFHFGYGKPRTPLFIEEFNGYRFGIFRNFVYGFFFNHLIAPAEDYRNRLEWYRDNVSAESVHAIEMAAEHCTLGPFWTHIAVPLSNVCLLDLDYVHTPSAVRPQNPVNRAACDALGRGYSIEVASR